MKKCTLHCKSRCDEPLVGVFVGAQMKRNFVEYGICAFHLAAMTDHDNWTWQVNNWVYLPIDEYDAWQVALDVHDA